MKAKDPQYQPAHVPSPETQARARETLGATPTVTRCRFRTFTVSRCAETTSPLTARPIVGPYELLPILDALYQEQDATKEAFFTLHLSSRNKVIGVQLVSIGTLNASIVHPREVWAPALDSRAASIVLVHNHPSGETDPSDDDLALTRRLVTVGELLGVGVLDHLIIGPRRADGTRAYTSLKQAGYL